MGGTLDCVATGLWEGTAATGAGDGGYKLDTEGGARG
jgi:hypothetical protein